MPPHLPRVGAFPIAGERSFMTAAGAALKIPAKERDTPLIGQFAPEILASDHLGRIVSLHATIELGRPIVLYFFPLAGSPHCTKESCSFRDAVGSSPIFNDLNAVVIGISQDPPSRSRRFVDEHHLGFRILHDEKRQAMATYGVGRGLLGLIDSRCTFIIDHEGIIRGMLEGVWDYEGHRNFAEKWLVRIEDELSGRERFYVEYEADDSVACDELSRNVKVIYGSNAASKGIASAPRHGAAPISSRKPVRTRELDPSPDSTVELADKPTLLKSKSRKNIKGWLRPDSTVGVEGYDEPVHVDFKYVNRSLDDVASNKQRTKSVARVQSLRLDKVVKAQEQPSPPLPANAVAIVREHEDRSPRSQQGSGSGWATPSTVSAHSHSTGETSIVAPRADVRETVPSTPSRSNTATSYGLSQELGHSSVERRGSARINSIATPTHRSSSLRKRRSAEYDHTRDTSNGSSSYVSRTTHGSDDAAQDAADAPANGSALPSSASVPIYANGNIAKLQLLPRDFAGERSIDSMASGSDSKTIGRASFSRPSDSPRSANASLPIPPRPASRAGFRQQSRNAQAQAQAAAESEDGSTNDSSLLTARRTRVNSQGSPFVPSPLSSPVRKQFRNGSSPRGSLVDVPDLPSGSAATRRQWSAQGVNEANGSSSVPTTPRSFSPNGPPNGSSMSRNGSEQGIAQGLGQLSLADVRPNGHAGTPRALPRQTPVPDYAPPVTPRELPTVPAPHRVKGQANGLGLSEPGLESDADESRRVSLTPSLTPSTTHSITASENEYSPSLVESHHTFGGSINDDDDDEENDHPRRSTDSY